MPSKDKYTDPKLRDEVKEEIHQSDKGGAPGQWSARKAQMMAQEYKRRGGDYNTDKSEKDESQKNLSKWTDEDWQTKDGSAHAKKEDGTQQRYLPKKAWENMTEEEKEETDKKKQEGSKEGNQYVSNTGKAQESRKKAGKTRKDDHEGEEEDEDEDDDNADEGENEDENDEDDDGDEADYHDDEDDDDEEDRENKEEEDGDDDEDAKAGQKRKSEQSNGSSKKQKDNSGKSNGSIGSKHMPADEPAPRGSKDRLPKKGQQITWKAMPGYVDGEVLEILEKGKSVDGKSVKASKDDPKIVLKSTKSGKICIHKPDACFYD